MLPNKVEERRQWIWADFEPHFNELLARPLSADNIHQWLLDWTHVSDFLGEVFSRANLATSKNTVDAEAEAHYKYLMENIYPKRQQVENELQKKLLESGLKPEGMELILRRMQTETEIFREENLPLDTKEQEVGLRYFKITGGQTFNWNGEEYTMVQGGKLLQNTDRAQREQIWRTMMNRWLQDRQAINAIWSELFEIRQQKAANAGFSNFRDLRWGQFTRFDYTPQDCKTFHAAIEQVVVPVARRLNEKRRRKLGLDSVRPWDIQVDVENRDPLRPYETIEEFEQKAETIFQKVDPKLGEYYLTMRRENLLDLPNRKNKRPGAFCTGFPYQRRPYVFMNAVGTRTDVRTLLHEMGHAFHNFEVMDKLPYGQQQDYPIEFAEVASMAMELLAAPYLTEDQGGYYAKDEAARDRIEHLEGIIFFWPYMAVVDSFQHWAYGGGDAAKDPKACDEKWAELWDRYISLDYTGFEDVKETGWHRKIHLYRYPFYYIEYGLAQLGAVQVWANALNNQSEAVAAYLRGLALGGTKSLPELFGTAGVKFAFDADTLGNAVELMEKTINDLES